MTLDAGRARGLLADFDLETLFIEELGWDRYGGRLEIAVDGQTYTLQGVAEKRGMVAYSAISADGDLPDYALRRKIEHQVARSVHEHLIVYANDRRTNQVWQWVRREPGRPIASREQTYRKGQSGEALIQKLDSLAFGLNEESRLTILDVAQRARAAFDVERITRRFYERFKSEHDRFLGFIDGLQGQEDREWYASITLNRLMFIYFIQKKGFLDRDRDYLRNRLQKTQETAGEDRFHSFYRHFLLRLFHEGLGHRGRTSELDALVGRVPYLNGGLFDVHELERENPDIQIPDEAFEGLFDFFDSYQWHLDDRPLHSDNEINPDVLGYIFEKYVNQKQMGAYYTKEDITGYIAANTVIPRFFEKLTEGSQFDVEQVRRLLAADPARYVHGPDAGGFGEDEAGENVDGNGGVSADSSRKRMAATRAVELRARLDTGGITSFAELTTLNLNLQQVAHDVVESCDSASGLLAIFERFASLSVLDPTCGSGAFLFAALNVLEPLYEATLERMAAFASEAREQGTTSDELAEFERILEAVDAHANRRFFILKTITVNNLYGVDIMEEAVEICKLRLFLKLVSQVDRFEHLEPLPDIDFNIRAGNALVGFTDLDHIRLSIEGGEQIQLDVHGALDQITEAAEGTREAFEHFRSVHLAGDAGDEAISAAKSDLRARQAALRTELDRYLASDYGIPVERADKYADWLETHQPFHWFVEFYGVMASGGFDVIIGNPPWREYAQVRDTYTVRGYETERCNNLHAFCTERALALRSSAGFASFIVQLPMVSAKRMAPVRAVLRARSSMLWMATFDDRPGKLFDGLENCRSTIFVSRGGAVGTTPPIAVTGYQRWPTAERELLFERLRFTEIEGVPLFPELFPKFQSDAQASVFAKMQARSDTTIAQHVRRTASSDFVFYQESARYWVKATLGLPHYARNGVVGAPPHGRYLYCDSAQEAAVIAGALNSSLFYLYFVAFGDCFHVSGELVNAFPFPASAFDDEALVTLSESLMRDIAAKADIQTIQTRAGDRIEYAEFNASESKTIIDEIDAVLATHYGFDDDELGTVREFDAAYRLGAADEVEA